MLNLNKRLHLELHMRRCDFTDKFQFPFCISNWLLWIISYYALKSFEHLKMKKKEIIFYCNPCTMYSQMYTHICNKDTSYPIRC